MAGRIPLGLVTGDTVDTLFAEIGVDDNGGDNPDNDLVIRDSNRNVVLRYDESAGAWVPGKFAFEDSAADPAANGELQRNGADLKAYSGGAVRNLSDVGAGALTDSGTDTDGGDDYTLPNAADNIDLQGDGAIQGADSVSTDDARISESIGYGGFPSEGAITLYVRNSGNDNNSGLSEGEAVQTLSAAFDRVPRLPIYSGGGNTAVIELGGGETYQISDEYLTTPWIAKTAIITSDGTQATLQAPTGADGINVQYCELQINDCRIEAADSGNPHNAAIAASRGGVITLRDGTTVFGGLGGKADGLVTAHEASLINVLSGATIDGNGNSGVRGTVAHGNSHVSMNGTVQNCDGGTFFDRGATGDLISPTMDNCSFAMISEDGSHAKLSTATVTNCSYAAYSRYGGVAEVQSLNDTTGTSTITSGEYMGATLDLRNLPASFKGTVWARDGWPIYEASELGAFFHVRQVPDASAGDLSELQMAFDNVNDRIVWKGSDGTARYWSSDGTL